MLTGGQHIEEVKCCPSSADPSLNYLEETFTSGGKLYCENFNFTKDIYKCDKPLFK